MDAQVPGDLTRRMAFDCYQPHGPSALNSSVNARRLPAIRHLRSDLTRAC